MYIIKEKVLKVYIYNLYWRKKRRSKLIIQDLEVLKLKKYDPFLKVYFCFKKSKALKFPDEMIPEIDNFLIWINQHFTIKTVQFTKYKIPG